MDSNQLKADIANAILNVESAKSLNQISQLKKLKGYKQFYRIKIGDYRIGIKIEADMVIFVDIDHLVDLITELSKTEKGITVIKEKSDFMKSIEKSFNELELVKTGKLKPKPARNIINEL